MKQPLCDVRYSFAWEMGRQGRSKIATTWTMNHGNGWEVVDYSHCLFFSFFFFFLFLCPIEGTMYMKKKKKKKTKKPPVELV